jgi:arylsulfatase A-like enzyme
MMRTAKSQPWRRLSRWVLAGLLALTPLLVSHAQSTNTLPPAPRRPSIIFILADDLGYGDIGCYGQTKIKTPNIDQLANEGIRFTQFYAGSTVCAPSRAAFLTGQHTGHIGIRGNGRNQALGADELTFAEILQRSGYRTGLIGKWGLGDEGSSGVPNKKGFDEFVGYLDHVHAHDYYTDYLWRYDPVTGYDGRMMFPENGGTRQGTYMHDVFTTAALNFIKNNKPDQFNKHRPFLLFLSYTIPHANNEYTRVSGNGMQVPSDAPYSDQAWPQTEKNKAAMITRMDRDVGRIVEQLKSLNIDDNTIVFFSSDNGPHKEGGVDPKFFNSSGPLRGIKRDLYEGGIRVPMIVRWPARIKPGQVSDFVWANWDFLPTAAEIARLKPPEKIDGISVLPLLTGREQTNRHEFLYWEFHEKTFQQAVRMDDWKGVRFGVDGPLELYDLKRDIGEKKNVAKENPAIVAKIENYLKTARTESARWPAKKAKPEAADETADGRE